MGHLSNPIALRLSYNKRWKDHWFVKNLYYPEFVNNILNIRDYLYYYLTTKDMLENGFCISHFYLIKINKLYYIKIFLYQIDLEKSSYEYINVLFKNYYEGLKKYTFINYRNINKSRKEIENNKIKTYISELHNADFLIYYYLYYIYFAKILDEQVILKNQFNINTNLKFKHYTNSIYNQFMNLLIERLKMICVIDIKNDIVKKWAFNRKKKLASVFPILLRFEQKKKLKKFEYHILDKFQIEEFKKKNDEIFSKYLYYKKNEYNKFFHKLIFSNQRKIDPIIFKNKEIEFVDLLFFLAKKINFKRYKSMIKLDKKWTYLQAYIKVFQNNSYIIKNFDNMKLFYYYMYKFIYICKHFTKHKLKKSDYLNIRDLLYFIIYNNIGYNAFFRVFTELTTFFKYFFSIFLYKMEVNKVTFLYYFMSNLNVTTHLISRYIGIRLQKNFTLLKTLNPLRRELKKLYKYSVQDQKIFSIYNYKYLYSQRKIQYKKKITNYIKLFNIFLKYFYFKYYKSYKNFLLYTIIKCHKEFEFNYHFFIKIFYINLYYRGLIEFFVIDNSVYNSKEIYIKNIIYYIFLLLKNSLYYFKKKVFKYNNKHIIISSYFYKNYINFKYLEFIWMLYKKFNYRFIRDKYIPKFKSMIMGYKMAFRGRFSRKQRASFIWLHNGKVPLNTLKTHIDYSFFIVALKNSVVSIKVWFYLNKNCLNYKYILKI